MASEEVLNVLREFAGATSQQLAKKDLAGAINNLRRDVVRVRIRASFISFN